MFGIGGTIQLCIFFATYMFDEAQHTLPSSALSYALSNPMKGITTEFMVLFLCHVISQSSGLGWAFIGPKYINRN